MKKFNELFNLIIEDITKNFNEKFCYIIGKNKIIQPNNELIQCIYVDKHLHLKINERTLDGDVNISINKIEEKLINLFVIL